MWLFQNRLPGAPWTVFEVPWGSLGVLGGPLALLGGPLGSPWGPVGVLGHPWGSLWVVLWCPLGPLGVPWVVLGVPWLVLGGLGGASRGLSEAPLRSLGGPWVILKSLKNHWFLLHFEALTSPEDAKGGKMPDSKASQEYTWPKKSP